MIPGKSRLLRDGFRAGSYRVIKTPYFSLKFKENSVGENRIGVIIGKSVDKRASQRNFWERQVKAEFLRAPNKEKDIIITLFPAVNKLGKADFIKQLRKNLHDLPVPRHF